MLSLDFNMLIIGLSKMSQTALAAFDGNDKKSLHNAPVHFMFEIL